jgi:hypothetical protein
MKNSPPKEGSGANAPALTGAAAAKAVAKVEAKEERQAAKQETRKQDEVRILSLAQVSGKFPTLFVDRPWDYEGLSLAGRAAAILAGLPDRFESAERCRDRGDPRDAEVVIGPDPARDRRQSGREARRIRFPEQAATQPTPRSHRSMAVANGSSKKFKKIKCEIGKSDRTVFETKTEVRVLEDISRSAGAAGVFATRPLPPTTRSTPLHRAPITTTARSQSGPPKIPKNKNAKRKNGSLEKTAGSNGSLCAATTQTSQKKLAAGPICTFHQKHVAGNAGPFRYERAFEALMDI